MKNKDSKILDIVIEELKQHIDILKEKNTLSDKDKETIKDLDDLLNEE